MIKLLAISGSLRSQSSNTRLVKRVAEIAEDAVKIDVFSDLDRLPHFNPDKEPSTNRPPAKVRSRCTIDRKLTNRK